MLPKWHALLGFVLSLILYLILKIELIPVLFFFVAFIAADGDHYIYYLFKTKTFNLKKAYIKLKGIREKVLKLPRKEINKLCVGNYFLHGIEPVLILAILGYFLHYYFYFAAVGLLLHVAIDITDQRRFHDRWDRVSIIWDYFEFKKLKRIF